MSSVKHRQVKTALILALAIFSLAFVAQLLWLRQAGPFSPTPWVLGALALPPLGATVAFLGLWHLSLRARGAHFAFAALPFWLVAVLSLAFWAAFYSIFVIGPAGGAAA